MLSQPKATMNNKVITAGTTENSANDGMRQTNLGTLQPTKADDQQPRTDESEKLISVLNLKKPRRSGHPDEIGNGG
jgi:hypothetical protein